jgi:hypothetical protein
MIRVACREIAATSFSWPGMGHERNGEQEAADAARDPRPLARRFADLPCERRLRLGGVFLGMMRRSIRSVTLSGTTLVLMPPAMSPTVRFGEPMPSIFETVFA